MKKTIGCIGISGNLLEEKLKKHRSVAFLLLLPENFGYNLSI